MKVLFLAAEAAPLVKVGGLADVAGALPKALLDLGCDIRLALPHHASVNLSQLEKVEYFRGGESGKYFGPDTGLLQLKMGKLPVLLFEEEAEQDLVARITYGGYVANPTDDELDRIGRDPFLLSYALRDIQNRCIVTTETSKPSRQGANRHIPDVCKDFGIKCINNFQLIKEMNFSTNWSDQ